MIDQLASQANLHHGDIKPKTIIFQGDQKEKEKD